MSTATSLIEECRGRGLTLMADGGRLVFAPQSEMTADLAARLSANKAAVLDAIEKQPKRRDALTIGGDTARGFPDQSDTTPRRPCWCCGFCEFAQDLAGHGWVCVRCHPPGELRAHAERCTVGSNARIGGTP